MAINQLAQYPGEMLDAGVQPLKFRQIVEGLIREALDDRLEEILNIYDINQIAVLVQITAIELDFDLIMVRVFFIFRSPITTDQEMLGDEIPFYSDFVHNEYLFLRTHTRPEAGVYLQVRSQSLHPVLPA